MKAVWLSSTYYLDPRVMALSPDAERLFVRSIAYCGVAETRGFVPDRALKTLGISAVFRRKSELVSSALWVPVEGGIRLAGWENWNQSGDDLLKRRESDRQRQARHRQPSRDMSRDVTPPEESREEENYLRSSSVSRDVPGASEERGGAKTPIDGWKLIRDLIPAEHPQAVRSGLAVEAATLLKAGTPETDIRDALRLWLAKPNLGPRVLPSLVSEVIRNRSPAALTRPSTTDQRVASIQALKLVTPHDRKEIR